MPTTRADVVATLSLQEPAALRAVLEAADVSPRRADDAPDLAERLADALWWHYATPLGYLAQRATFDEIVDHVARRLGQDEDLAGDAWTRLEGLTSRLGARHGALRFEEIGPQHRDRLRPAWVPPTLFALGSSGSFGAFGVGRVVVRIGRTPVGRVLPYIPHIGPWWSAVHRGGRAAAVVGGPLGVAFAALAVNASLGTSYRHLLPLLLGIGALGPRPVAEAVEVDGGH